MKRTWLITGCSTGLGHAMAHEALKSGDNVIVTARNPSTVEGFSSDFPNSSLVLTLDVTKKTQIESAVKSGIEKFGRIDILVNNAGFGIIGAVEETPEADSRKIFDTNFFGQLEMTRSVIPIMRRQGSGHILNLSSVGGFVSMPGLALYNATKFAIEGLSEALAAEVRSFGIKLTLIQPGPFRTKFVGNSSVTHSDKREYNYVVDNTRKYMDQIDGKQPGNPELLAKAIYSVTQMANPPLRLPLGKVTVNRFRAKIAQMEEELKNWEKVAAETDYN